MTYGLQEGEGHSRDTVDLVCSQTQFTFYLPGGLS